MNCDGIPTTLSHNQHKTLLLGRNLSGIAHGTMDCPYSADAGRSCAWRICSSHLGRPLGSLQAEHSSYWIVTVFIEQKCARPKAAEVEPSQQAQSFRQARKLVGTGGIENADRACSRSPADGHTVIVGGPGPNNVDRDRSPSRPCWAAWVFTLRGAGWMEQGKLVGTTSQQRRMLGRKVRRSRFRPMAKPRLSVDLATTVEQVRRGYSRWAIEAGSSKARS